MTQDHGVAMAEVGVNSSVKRRSTCSADRALCSVFPPRQLFTVVHTQLSVCVFLCLCVCVLCFSLMLKNCIRGIRHAITTTPDVGHRHRLGRRIIRKSKISMLSMRNAPTYITILLLYQVFHLTSVCLYALVILKSFKNNYIFFSQFSTVILLYEFLSFLNEDIHTFSIYQSETE